MKIEGYNIGDEFILTPYTPKYSVGNKWVCVKCLDPNKKFEICGFSKSGISIYYIDSRTNNNCKCERCVNWSNRSDMLKSIATYNIQITQTKIQKNRDKTIGTLLKNN